MGLQRIGRSPNGQAFKQGVHKIAAAAMQSLKDHLESQGYCRLDSVDLLKSFRVNEVIKN